MSRILPLPRYWSWPLTVVFRSLGSGHGAEAITPVSTCRVSLVEFMGRLSVVGLSLSSSISISQTGLPNLLARGLL